MRKTDNSGDNPIFCKVWIILARVVGSAEAEDKIKQQIKNIIFDFSITSNHFVYENTIRLKIIRLIKCISKVIDVGQT